MSPLNRRYTLEALIAASILAILLMLMIPKFQSKPQPKVSLPQFPENNLLGKMTAYPLNTTLEEYKQTKRDNIGSEDPIFLGREFQEPNSDGYVIHYQFYSDYNMAVLEASVDYLNVSITSISPAPKAIEGSSQMKLTRILAVGSNISTEQVCSWINTIIEHLGKPDYCQLTQMKGTDLINIEPIWKAESWVMSLRIPNRLEGSLQIQFLTSELFRVEEICLQDARKSFSSIEIIIDPTDTIKIKQIPQELWELITPVSSY